MNPMGRTFQKEALPESPRGPAVAFAPSPPSQSGARCGELVTVEVQHFPVTFRVLLDAFLNENQIELESIKLEFCHLASA